MPADGVCAILGMWVISFSSLSDAEHFGDLAFVGHYDGDAGLAEGFAEAAEAIFSAWQDQEWANDRLLLPIAYNYRHALELALKQAIRDAAECRQLGGGDPGLTAQALEAHFSRSSGTAWAPAWVPGAGRGAGRRAGPGRHLALRRVRLAARDTADQVPPPGPPPASAACCPAASIRTAASPAAGTETRARVSTFPPSPRPGW
jgi:hypothetical protein